MRLRLDNLCLRLESLQRSEDRLHSDHIARLKAAFYNGMRNTSFADIAVGTDDMEEVLALEGPQVEQQEVPKDNVAGGNDGGEALLTASPPA